MSLKTYTALYAEDVPHYAFVEISAANDQQAIARARKIDSGQPGIAQLDPDWSHPVCRRIVSLETHDGRTIAESIPLDSYRLADLNDSAPVPSAPSSLEEIPIYSIEHGDEVIGYTLTDDPGCERHHHHVPIDPLQPGAPLLLAGFPNAEEATAFATGLAYGLGDDCGYVIHHICHGLTCVLVEFFTARPAALHYDDMRPRSTTPDRPRAPHDPWRVTSRINRVHLLDDGSVETCSLINREIRREDQNGQ